MVSLGHAKRLHRRVQLAAQLQQLFTLDATFADAGQVVAAQVVDAFAAVADFAGGATLLGGGPIQFRQGEGGLTLEMPPTTGIAPVVRLEGRGLA